MSSSVGSLTLQTTPGSSVGPISGAYDFEGSNILIDAACPGFVSTDLNEHRGTRTPQQGAAIAIKLATLPDDGPTGTYCDDAGPIPW